MSACSIANRCIGLVLLLALAGCGGGKRMEEEYPPTPIEKGEQEGVSSWYGKKFHGRPTASGEIYDMHDLTAAHRTLPLGTIIRVTNLDNGRSAKLKVNDRGPFVKGRILDCSYGAAKELGFAGAGLAPVRIEILKPGKGKGSAQWASQRGSSSGSSARTGTFCVQAGAFQEKERAERFRDQLDREFGDAYIVRFADFHRVRVGHFGTEEDAEKLARRLGQRGYQGIVTRND